ncbi:hypothetical protein ACLOJK_022700 [Asimina triloba]
MEEMMTSRTRRCEWVAALWMGYCSPSRLAARCNRCLRDRCCRLDGSMRWVRTVEDGAWMVLRLAGHRFWWPRLAASLEGMLPPFEVGRDGM